MTYFQSKQEVGWAEDMASGLFSILKHIIYWETGNFGHSDMTLSQNIVLSLYRSESYRYF